MCGTDCALVCRHEDILTYCECSHWRKRRLETLRYYSFTKPNLSLSYNVWLGLVSVQTFHNSNQNLLNATLYQAVTAGFVVDHIRLVENVKM